MEIVNTLMTWLMKRRMEQIENFMNNPIEVQQTTLSNLLFEARNTEWGRKYKYHEINNYETYCERVPVSTYEQMYPYIERQLKGEQNVLWGSEVRWFAKSSGTTNARSKFIPVSYESMENCHFKGGKDLLTLFVHNVPDTKAFMGKGLSLGGSLQPNPFNAETYVGDISAVVMKNLPIWAEFFRSPGLETALMDKWEDKIERMATECSQENITTLLGVPTWTVVLINKILALTGKSNILEVWPNLEVFFHGAVAFGPYQELFRQMVPSPAMKYLETYNASEGFFAIQDRLHSDDLLLMLDYGVFYEFVPVAESGSPFPSAVQLDGVEPGKNYAMIISTNGGLWRYMIGDTIKFTSVKPYRIKITGRTKSFINAFGEELIIENAETGIARACEATGASISNFTAGPKYFDAAGQGAHEWLIEFELMPRSMEHFTAVLDETMRSLNSDYDAKRYKDLALSSPIVQPVPAGTFNAWLKSKGKLGGQHKVPRLCNDRYVLEEVLAMV